MQSRPNMNLVNRVANMLAQMPLNMSEPEMRVSVHQRLENDWSEEAIFLAYQGAKLRLSYKGA